MTMEKRLIRNKIKCLLCGDIIESTHRHDFKYCSCGSCLVDGGLEYIRYGGDHMENIECLHEWEEVDDCDDSEG